MFTGIITHLGKVSKKTDKRLTIKASQDFLSKIEKGTSISVDGICLTVVNTNRQYFKVEFMPETEKRTNIKYLQPGNLVNLELPATPVTFLSGHTVQGHVDGVARLESIAKLENSFILKLIIPSNLSGYIAEKGSVAINGISLTVIKTGKNFFTVGIVPYTWKNTMLKNIKLGDFLNVEVDILAKYLARIVINKP